MLLQSSAVLPSRTYECCPCEQTFFAGSRSGPGPFACDLCGAVLTLRADGAEAYCPDLALPRAEGKQTAASLATLPLFGVTP